MFEKLIVYLLGNDCIYVCVYIYVLAMENHQF
jgi:hypothetical protein